MSLSIVSVKSSSVQPSNPRVVHFAIIGQSQADGFLSTPALTTISIPNTFALGPFSNGRAPNTSGGNLVALAEYDINATRAETIATSMSQQIKAWANDPDLEIVISNHSQNSQTIAQLSKGGSSGQYEEAIASVERVSNLSSGKDYECHLIFYHGGGGENPYDTQLQQLISDFRTDVAPFTTQSNVEVFIDQQRQVGDPDYSIQSLDVSELDANVTISHPRYVVEYGGDNVHLTNHGSRHSGLLFAQTIYKKLFQGSYDPLKLGSNVSVSGGNLTIPLEGVQGTLSGAGNYGIEVYDFTNSSTIPGSYSLSGNNVQFTPSTPVNDTITTEIRSQLGASGSLSSSSDLTTTFTDASSNPYSLDKFLVRDRITSVINWSNTHTLNLTTGQAHNIDFTQSPYDTIQPGDTIIIPDGSYTKLTFRNFTGDPGQQTTVINGSGGVIDLTNNNTGLNLIDVSYMTFTGTGSSDQYGFRIHPTTAVALSSTGVSGYGSGLIFENIEVFDCGFAGFFMKLDLSSDPSTWRANFVMSGLTIRNCFIHDTGGEGMYLGTTIGPTSYDGQIRLPHLITDCHVYDNTLNNCGWDGIQVSRCTDHLIYNNTITNYGLENQAGQNKGIAIANESTGSCYLNEIDTGNGSGIDCFGGADNTIHTNKIINAGEHGIFINDNAVENDYPGYEAGTTVRPGYTIAANTIISPTSNGVQFNGTDIDNKRLYNTLIAGVGGTNVVVLNGGLTLDEQGSYFNTIVNVQFTDSANGDYTLAAGSPAREQGIDLTSLGITTDFAGTARPQGANYDSGAYEGVQVDAFAQSVIPINTVSNGSSNNPRGYIESLPQGYNTRNDWPVIIWFHGLGEAGDGSTGDLNSMLSWTINPYVAANDVPFVVITPQDFNGYFSGSPSRMGGFVEWARQHYSSKTNEFNWHCAYISASGAGFSTWVGENTDTFRAMASHTNMADLKGNGDATKYQNLVDSNSGVWMHHGDADGTVGIGTALSWFRGIVPLIGGEDFARFRFTRYDGLGHSAWNEVYDNSGTGIAQDTGDMGSGGGNYYFWASGTWYEWLLSRVKAPVNTPATNITISNDRVENNATIGDSVGSFGSNAIPDATYSLVSGTGDTDNARFTLTGGVLFTAETYSGTATYSIRVQATNSEGSYSQAIPIELIEPISITDITLNPTSFTENTAIGTTVSVASAVGTSLLNPSYDLVAGTGDNNNADILMDGANLQIQRLVTNASDDPLSFRLRASEGNASFEKALTLGVDAVSAATTIFKVNFTRGSMPQTGNTDGWTDWIDNAPSASDNITIGAYTLTITDGFLSSSTTTHPLPTVENADFPNTVVGSSWHDRFGGTVDITGLNNASTYNFRFYSNTYRTTDNGVTITATGSNSDSVTEQPQESGDNSKVLTISNISPTGGVITIGWGGSDPNGSFRFGHACALIVEEN